MDVLAADFFATNLIESAGDIDGVIIALGDMGKGDASDLDDIARVGFVNYIAPAQIAAYACATLAAKNGGTVVIISSVAGDRGRKRFTAYGSAKAALNAFASGLRNHYCKQNVHVMTVKPGFVDTPMTWGMTSKLIASRERVACAIINAMHKKKDVVYVPFFWRIIMLVIQHIPEKIFKRLSL